MALHGLTWPYISLHTFALKAITSNYIVITRYYMNVIDMQLNGPARNYMGQHVITRHYMHIMAGNYIQ